MEWITSSGGPAQLGSTVYVDLESTVIIRIQGDAVAASTT